MGICKESFVNKFIAIMQSVYLLPPLNNYGMPWKDEDLLGIRNEIHHNIFVRNKEDMIEDEYYDYIKLHNAVIEGSVQKMKSIVDKDIYNRKKPPHGHYKNILMALAIKYNNIDCVEFLEKVW